MRLYIITEKYYYTDGTGLIRAIAVTKQKAIDWLRENEKNLIYNKHEDYFERDETQTLFKISLYNIPFVE
jgi:hypothetical protein